MKTLRDGVTTEFQFNSVSPGEDERTFRLTWKRPRGGAFELEITRTEFEELSLGVEAYLEWVDSNELVRDRLKDMLRPSTN